MTLHLVLESSSDDYGIYRLFELISCALMCCQIAL